MPQRSKVDSNFVIEIINKMILKFVPRSTYLRAIVEYIAT